MLFAKGTDDYFLVTNISCTHMWILFLPQPFPRYYLCMGSFIDRIISYCISLDNSSYLPLPHSSADAFEHEPGGFVGRSDHCRQLNG